MARLPAPRRQRRAAALEAFDAIKVEGALLQPEMIVRIADLQASDQAPADYGLDPNEKLREVVQTKFTLAQALYARFLGSDRGPQASQRFLGNLFSQVFELADLARTDPVAVDGRAYPIGHAALGGRAPVVFAPAGQLEQALPQFGDGGRRRSASQLLQEYLNVDDRALWGLVCDGARLRLYRDNSALTRPAFIEADLARILGPEAPRLADFAALWLLIHGSRFGAAGAQPSDCPLERWREEGRKHGATVREQLARSVEAALLELGLGFLEHPANDRLREEIRSGTLSPQGLIQALLRLVYRFIFILTAEDREVLHTPAPEDADDFKAWSAAKQAYARGYSLGRLRDRAQRRASRDRHTDAWDGVRILFRALWRGEKRLALPALGGLFADGDARDLTDFALSNARAYEAIFQLGWHRTDAGLQRVNWRDMETEELGSVYETLLELNVKPHSETAFELVSAAGQRA